VHFVADQKVKVAFLASESDDPEGFPRLELVAPDHPDSPIAKFIERRGEGLHHICLLVENLKERLGELKQAGVRLIDEEPRVGAEGDLIAFVHPSATGGVLIELQQA
jgi:methylmalonyl-CoA epimerase